MPADSSRIPAKRLIGQRLSGYCRSGDKANGN
jgi:hypothetical protein